MEIKFVVVGEPFGKKRPRARVIGGHASIHNDPANERYELKVINAFQQAYPDNEYPIYEKGAFVKAKIVAKYAIPKAFSKKQRLLATLDFIRPTKKPDLDNVAKTILDALNGFVYHDDAQVVSLEIEKIYGENASVSIELWRI